MSKEEVGLMEKIIKFFRETKKTGWGKREIVDKITDIWLEHLEEIVDGNDK